MSDTDERSICRKAIKKYGIENQLIVAVEELSELQKALCKFLRGSITNVEEETADVEIMLTQIEEMFDSNKIEKWKTNKLQRLEQRIEDKEYKG